jgi:hypothetical protein
MGSPSRSRLCDIPALTWDVDDGTEIRLFDPRRNPQNWIDLMHPTECAVFLKHRTTTAALRADGHPFPTSNDTTCTVFRRLDDARQFCEARVQALPHLRCEIYDAQGLAHPPLLVVIHHDHQPREDASARWSRCRKLIAGALFLISIPLIWFGTRQSPSSDLATFLAINCIFVALRFIYWNAGINRREKERRKRVEAHCKMERGDA